MVDEKFNIFNPKTWGSSKPTGGVVELDESQPSPDELNFLRWGKSGTEINSGFFDEEYLQKLQGLRGQELWDEMKRSDGQIRMLLNVVKSPILRAKWFVNAVDESDEEIFIKEFCEFVLFSDIASPCGLKRKTWMQFLEEALDSVDSGFALFEIQNKVVRNHSKYGDYIGLKDIAWRSPKTIEEWDLNYDGTINYVRQASQGDLDVDVKMPGKFLMPITINKVGDNYEGISALRFVYGNFFRKSLLRHLEGVGYERGILGVPLGTIPKDKTDKTQEITAFENMLSLFTSHEQSFLTKPEGWDIENFKIDFDGESLLKAIENENKEMSKAFLANFMELGMSSGSGGSFALGSDLSDIFLSAIEIYAKKITEAVNNRIIRQVVDAKFGKRDVYPTLDFSGINDKAGKEQSEILKNLAESGFIDPTDSRMKAWVHNRFGFIPFIESNEKEIDKKGVDNVDAEDDEVDTTNLSEIFSPIFLGEEGREFVTLKFDKNLFTREGARAWANNHGFKVNGLVDEDEMNHVISQQETLKIYDTVEVQKLANGVTVTIGITPRGIFSEVQLAETPSQVRRRVTSMIKERSVEIKKVMREGLGDVSKKYVDEVRKFLENNPKSKWSAGVLALAVPGMNAYKKSLRAVLVDVVSDATSDAKMEVPGSTASLAEESLAGVPRGTIDALNAELKLLTRTQEADLEKRVLFQFGISSSRSEDINTIVDDISQNAVVYVEGAAIGTAAANASSALVNVSRFEVFQAPEVYEQIESLIFMNQDPQAHICKNLQNRVFRKDDPAAQTFLPPLHHNCESILVPQFIGAKGNRPIDPLGLQPTETNPDGTKTDMKKIMKSKSW